MRLIDADALNYSTHRECAGHGEYYDIEIITKSKIDNAPTIDAEPIVRCKECKNAGRKMGTHYHCEQQMSWHEEEYFCSFGERSEP